MALVFVRTEWFVMFECCAVDSVCAVVPDDASPPSRRLITPRKTPIFLYRTMI